MAKKQLTKISELIPDDKNFNLGSEFGNSLIEKSFRKFGAGRSILIDKNNRIIAGNKSVENATAVGIEDLQIVESDGKRIIAVKRTDIDLDTPEGRELALADNATAKANIVFDAELIEAEVGEAVCEEWGIELKENEVEEDDFAAEPPLNPITVLGDLYELNQHRVLCGDSTDSDAVAKLMNGKFSDMIHTDPPYNIDYGSSKNPRHKIRKIENDSMNTNDWEQFCKALYANFKLFNKGDIYMWGDSGPEGMRMRLWLIEMGAHWSATIIWKKQQLVLSPAKYQRIYEPCFYGWFDKSTYVGDRKQVELWEVDRPQNSILHPTMKPLALCAKAILNSSKPRDIVLDFFLGSGSTLIASDEIDRTCYGLELSPNYADVIVARFIKYKRSQSNGTEAFTVKRNGSVLSEKDLQKYLAQIEPKQQNNGKTK